MVSRLVSTSGHLLMHMMKVDPMFMHVLAQDVTVATLELYLPSSVKTTFVKLEVGKCLITISSIMMIHSGMVRDVEVIVLAVSSTIHRGSASISLNQLQTILS